MASTFNEDIEGVKELTKLIGVLKKDLKAVSDGIKEANKSLKFDNIKSIEKVDDEIKKITQAEKELIKIKKTEEALNAKLNSLRKGEQNEILKTRQAIQSETKAIKDNIKATKSLTPLYDKQRKKLALLQKELTEHALKNGIAAKSTQRLAREVNKLNNRITGAEQLGGRFQRQVGKYPKLLGGAALAFGGAALGVQGFIRGIGAAVKIAKEFEQSNANLAAILGKTKEEITFLTEDAKRLGAATAFSASEVSGLQTEFAKLGFNEQEILNATEATLNLAAATGSDLGEAAAIAGATLGGFGLGAEETARVTDVMAKSFSTSALDIEKFKESMKDAAPAAKAVGVSVEKTTALLGTLSNAGISGSKAGTALRAGFIKLNEAGLSLDDALLKISNSQDKLGEATKLVGVRAATSFLVLSEGIDTTKELEKGLQNAGGAAEKMALEQLDTLEGSLKILNSAWEGFVLGLLDGEGVFSDISRGLVDFATKLLGGLTPMKDLTQETFDNAIANRDLANSTEELLNEYEDLVKEGIEPTAEEKQRLEEITLDLVDAYGESIVTIDEETGAFELNTEAVRQQIKIKRLASDQEAATLASRLKGVQEEIKQLEREQNTRERIFETRTKQAEKLGVQEAKRAKQAESSSSRFSTNIGLTKEQQEADTKQLKAKGDLVKVGGELLNQRELEADLLEKLKKLNFTATDIELLFTESIKDNTKAVKDNSKERTGLTDAQKAFNKRIKEQIELLKEQQRLELLLAGDNDLLKLKLRDEHLNQINELELKIIGQTSNEKKLINSKLNNDLLANDIARLNKQREIEKKTIDEQIKIQTSQESAEFKLQEFRKEQEIKNAKNIDERVDKELELNALRTTKLLEQEGLLEDEKTLILEKEEAKRLEILKKGEEDKLKLQKKTDADTLEERKKAAEKSREIINAVADFQKEKFEEDQKRLDEEIQASEDQQDRLRELADRGSEDAQKNLASEQKREAELRAQKQREIENQKRTELLFTGLDVYSKKLAEGQSSGQAAIGTITDITLLSKALRALPLFKEGVEDTGTVRNPLDKDGGRLGIFHDNERIVDKINNSKMKGITNYNLGELAESYKRGELIQAEQNKINVLGSSWLSNSQVINKLSEIEKTLSELPGNMPDSTLNVDLVKQVMTLTESREGKKVNHHIPINKRKSWG